MRFMMIMFPPKSVDAGTAIPDPSVFERMARYNEELAKAGVLLALDGLQPTSKGARITVKNGKRQVVDGPFTEAKEVVGGYWMIQVRSREEAIEWATRVPLTEDGSVVELRQVFEMTDFPEEVQKLDRGVAEHLAKKQ